MLGSKKDILDTTSVVIKVEMEKRTYIDEQNNNSYKNITNYTGKDIYIGIVTSEDIDCFDIELLKEDATSKVRCVWEQIDKETGSYYIPTRREINKNITENINIKDTVKNNNKIQENMNVFAEESRCGNNAKIMELDMNDTTWLGVTTGNGDKIVNKSLIPNSEILVAKIKSAPANIQDQYCLHKESGLSCTADILIGVKKLVQLAKLNNKPIVIYIPYNYVLTSLEGLSIYDREFREISYINGVTLVMPGGEEADKMRREHLRLDLVDPIEISCKNEKQIIRGKISSEKVNEFKAYIVPNEDYDKKIYIHEAGVFKLDNAEIKTSGVCWEDNGELTINFRILQERRIKWKVIIEGDNSSKYEMNITLAEGKLSQNVTLSKSEGLDTINTGIYRCGAIGVGSFDTQSFVTMQSSGRTSKKYINRLDCVADGKIYLNKVGQNGATMIEGTSVACSKVVGAVALLYEYFIENVAVDSKNEYLPNTQMMRRWLRAMLTGLPEQDYPSISQGYGILDTKKLYKFINGDFL